MNEDEVTAWLAGLEHPLKEVILAVRATFMYQGNLASIDPKAKKHVAVLFHRGAEIPGEHPILVGEGRVARYARFPDLASVDSGRAALTAVTRAWCDAN
jgi:hypothetical protein